MTGTEISTAVRLGLDPVFLILNNDGRDTMRQICEGSFNQIMRWNYDKICELVGGGTSANVETKGELDDALRSARDDGGLRVLNLVLPRADISPQLETISREVKQIHGFRKVGAAEPRRFDCDRFPRKTPPR